MEDKQSIDEKSVFNGINLSDQIYTHTFQIFKLIWGFCRIYATIFIRVKL